MRPMAKVFSNPQINVAALKKRGPRAQLDGEVAWDLSGDAADIADGDYTVAIRPNDILPERTETATVEMSGVVQITELTGSESSAHFSFGENHWVSQSRGVQAGNYGTWFAIIEHLAERESAGN